VKRTVARCSEYAVKTCWPRRKYPERQLFIHCHQEDRASQYDVEGFLTIRDVSRPVVVAASLPAAASDTLSLEGSARSALTDFKLKPPTCLRNIGTRTKWRSFRVGRDLSDAAVSPPVNVSSPHRHATISNPFLTLEEHAKASGSLASSLVPIMAQTGAADGSIRVRFSTRLEVP